MCIAANNNIKHFPPASPLFYFYHLYSPQFIMHIIGNFLYTAFVLKFRCNNWQLSTHASYIVLTFFASSMLPSTKFSCQ